MRSAAPEQGDPGTAERWSVTTLEACERSEARPMARRGSGAGKSTVTSILADTFELRVYTTDAQIAARSAGAGPDAPLLTGRVITSRGLPGAGRRGR
jgi:hypothetical protein